MNTNPMQLINFLKTAQNPQQFVCNMIGERMGDNPFFANLLSLAQNGRGNEIEGIARNMFKEKGLDFNSEFNNFKKSMGL